MYYDSLYFGPTWLLMIPAIVFTLFAQIKVKRAFSVYSKIPNRTQTTGAQAARKVLDANGLGDVDIEIVEGRLTDHYDPRERVLRLSPDVCQKPTVAAVSIAAHEAGHAIQHAKKYKFLTFRNAMVPVTRISTWVSWILIAIGISMGGIGAFSRGTPGAILLDIGILFFVIVVLFQLVTLPVEFNASRRAIIQLQDLGIVGSDEIRGSKKVLSAAALTYVAALASAILSLIRILIIRGDR